MIAQPRGSVFAVLRDLVPKRALTFSESFRIVELQAARFRELLQVADDALVPSETIASLPRVLVTSVSGLPVSGVSQWHNGRWIIALNSTEPHGRQRFTLGHELAHCINFTTRLWLDPAGGTCASPRTRQLCEYFSACLLMPKRHVKRLVGQRQSPAELAESFDVSLQAVVVRLAQLGLTDPLPRCAPEVNSWHHLAVPYRPLGGSERIRA
jgi:Zn-dependent peptidase ImmA (M78 family)